MNITKEEALTICRDLWMWLAKNPHARKENWPKWCDILNKYEKEEFTHNCPCCEFASQETGRLDCTKCLLVNFAWSAGDFSCERDVSSPFHKWFYKIGDRRTAVKSMVKAAAKDMVKACDKALEQLTPKKVQIKKPVLVKCNKAGSSQMCASCVATRPHAPVVGVCWPNKNTRTCKFGVSGCRCVIVK